MSWLTPKLSKRIDICKPIQDPDHDGGFDTTFEVMCSVWASIVPVNSSAILSLIRGMQINQTITHNIIVRQCAVETLKTILGENAINPIKSNYFIFLRGGMGGPTSRGRRFAIRNVSDANEAGEYYKIAVEELNEEGANY